jgi:hypothetical protein
MDDIPNDRASSKRREYQCAKDFFACIARRTEASLRRRRQDLNITVVRWLVTATGEHGNDVVWVIPLAGCWPVFSGNLLPHCLADQRQLIDVGDTQDLGSVHEVHA